MGQFSTCLAAAERTQAPYSGEVCNEAVMVSVQVCGCIAQHTGCSGVSTVSNPPVLQACVGSPVPHAFAALRTCLTWICMTSMTTNTTRALLLDACGFRGKPQIGPHPCQNGSNVSSGSAQGPSRRLSRRYFCLTWRPTGWPRTRDLRSSSRLLRWPRSSGPNRSTGRAAEMSLFSEGRAPCTNTPSTAHPSYPS